MFFPHRDGRLFEGGAGGVHQDIDAAELLDDGIAQRVDRAAVPHVGYLAQRAAAHGFNFSTEFSKTVLTPARRGHNGAVPGKANRERPAESGRGADDDGNTIGYIQAIAHFSTGSIRGGYRW